MGWRYVGANVLVWKALLVALIDSIELQDFFGWCYVFKSKFCFVEMLSLKCFL